jgi:hypothetical protein
MKTGMAVTDYELLNEGATVSNGQVTFRGKLYEYVGYDELKRRWIFSPVVKDIDEIDPLQLVYQATDLGSLGIAAWVG